MRRSLRSGLTLGVAAVVAVVGLRVAGGLDGLLSNPFRSERTERVDPAILTALQHADQLRAATAELQVVVEIEDDTRLLPDVLSGRRTTFLAAGTVDATVDLGEATVERTPDGGVVVTLPAPVLDRVVVDSERSRVVDRDRGLFDRIGDSFSSNPTDDRGLYVLAERELAGAALAGPLLDEAEVSASAVVESLVAAAVGPDVPVTVRFATPEAPADR